VFALALTAVAVLISLLMRPALEPNAFLLFMIAVWLSAWYHGRTGGAVAAGASTLAVLYFFLRPGLSAADLSWSTLARLLGFVLMALLIAWVTAAWRESRQLLAATLSSIGDAILVTDSEGRVTFLNPVAETLTGWSNAEAHRHPSSEVLRLIDEKTREAVENPLSSALRDRIVMSAHPQTVLLSRSGTEVPIEHNAAPVRDDDGRLRGGILVFRDTGKRRQFEEQSSQAQKMDAVGRLAGGVAGDFNNVLTVITGYVELLRGEIPSSSPLRRFIDEIGYAGERAAALTRQLLAFSRGATALPRVLDLNEVIAGIEPMLRRLLGDQIELILLAGPDLGRVKADPAQIEQVIMNLATNSRDALPQGGKVVIETGNVDLEEGPASANLGVKPGSYVLLALSDTGVGMDAGTRSRLFEPFFTTKAPGKGSGLGLATVYGAIRQADGQVSVYSQPGCGTIFEIYLPRVVESVAAPRKGSGRGSETILLVDDEEGVRRLVLAVLRSNGYDVLEAGNGPAALTAYEKNAHKIDLVLTDVVMPQMSGFDLGRQLSDRAPGLKILYMSGYRDNFADAEAQRAFLHKPFTPDDLLAKVREVLDTETTT
jgi:two-component system, cell cycle sensor histidine kinase and response regulator CckA